MDREAIAKKMLELRGSKPQWEVAKALGISQNALSMYEKGERIPRDEIKMRIAMYYDQEIQDIFLRSKYTKCESRYRRNKQ